MIIFDNHLHLRRDGRFLEAVKDFKKAGGTHFVLCQYPMPEVVIKEKTYQGCYEKTLRMAEEIRSIIDVTVLVTVGPYPVDYLRLVEVFGREQTMAIMQEGMDIAARLCKEQRCVAIGEIGRPHFPVDMQVMKDSMILLEYGMVKAKEVGVPVVIHSESTTPEQCQELMVLGRRVGLPAEKIVKHFAPPLITPEENFGLMPSVLASKKNVEVALSKGSRFMMETDYIDDVRRPGAVLGPKTVPVVTRRLIDSGVMSMDQAVDIHQRNPLKTYGVVFEE
ncbi:MAG: TatD family hydrolase [Methanobacteriota archaeon]